VIGEDIDKPLSLSANIKTHGKGEGVARSLAPNDFFKSLCMLGPEIETKDPNLLSH